MWRCSKTIQRPIEKCKSTNKKQRPDNKTPTIVKSYTPIYVDMLQNSSTSKRKDEEQKHIEKVYNLFPQKSACSTQPKEFQTNVIISIK